MKEKINEQIIKRMLWLSPKAKTIADYLLGIAQNKIYKLSMETATGMGLEEIKIIMKNELQLGLRRVDYTKSIRDGIRTYNYLSIYHINTAYRKKFAGHPCGLVKEEWSECRHGDQCHLGYKCTAAQKYAEKNKTRLIGINICYARTAGYSC